MKFNITQFIIVLAAVAFTVACGGKEESGEKEAAHHEHEEGSEIVELSAEQFEALDMKVDTLPLKNLSSMVQANGQLKVPPQNEATVTAIIGANVSSIKVIEGDEVKKGQVLAYLTHPNLTRLQGDYLETWNNLQFLEQDYQRQKRLYEEEVGSGKAFQQTQADYRSTQGMVKSLESQLRQFGMNPVRIKEGNFYDQVPVISPIDGSIVSVEVRTGQFVQPEKVLFEIVNIDHILAELMIFEKDVHKVKEGQRVRFTVETLPGKELYAEIYSVGKKFEQDPKAVRVHAEIENKSGNLIPGMYIKGQVLTDSAETYALPESAIIREGDQFLAFLAERKTEGESGRWIFTPIEVVTGISSNGWIAVKFLQEIPAGALFAMNNAYYLISEMKKGETGDDD
ncbi:efflux RND transporter periplasmic adaptor subunit [Cecembia calidifontis]|uniref:Cobalt-zinc-cadmium efflux system membrane fusion protein n=1 Tax=Cecembia calidifontis TaxID=1187080 RepID=A0A4Q7PBY7_9BACT|nr:efflux RND transporter periplasmic adaptor subunit [Cecembia calidifontis]RZS97527.1 cobalt-zinc-cadmium efflux system membrane fusion protein [Cecembia calidifontis]